jgi:D-alanine-D-alanine ligase
MKIAVVCGGPSSEAEVSRASAAGVTAALAAGKHEVVQLELDPLLPEALRTSAFDVVFPVVHGAVGEDGCLQGMLEVLELPYVGSGVLASALAMDKAVARVVLAAAGCAVPRGVAVSRHRSTSADAAARARREVGAALVVKPASSGSAIGVVRLEGSASDADVTAAIEAAWSLDETAVVEEFVRGREITCSVLDVGGTARALAATEIASPMDAFYTYEARYAPGRSNHTCPAQLGEALTADVFAMALLAHRTLGCRDLSRADFVVGDRPILLEVNTLPGMTATSLFPEAAGVAGLAFPALCDALAQNALRRGTARRNRPRPFPG